MIFLIKFEELKKVFYITSLIVACFFNTLNYSVANVTGDENIVAVADDFTFSIDYDDEELNLTWENPPKDLVRFKIERSLDGQKFSRIYQSSFTDERSFPDDLSYIDTEEVFYRFVFELSSGKSITSEVQSISLLSSEHLKPIVFVRGQQIEFSFFSSSEGFASAQLFNSVGNLVNEEQFRTSKGDNKNSIVGYGIRPGLYFIRLEMNGKSTTTKFFVR